MPSKWLILSLLLTLTQSAFSITFDCEHIRTSGKSWNFGTLKGPKEVHHQTQHTENIHNTTYTIDICDKLGKIDDVPEDDQCDDGTRICAVDRVYHNDGKVDIEDVREIAGQYTLGHGKLLEPKFERLKDSTSNEDAEKEGVRVILHGGIFMKKNQKAIIEFICDHNMTGNEGFESSKAMTLLDTRAINATAEDGDEEEEPDEPEDGDDGLPDLDRGKALQFRKFDIGEKVDTLRLEWRTKYACEDAVDDDKDEGGDDGKNSGGWGFFTWFIIVLFLLAATYLIFGSWLNYNRYGARGWDLIPHGDFIRDLPYILKDFGSNIMDRIRGVGGGSRGGYSAV